MYWLSWESTMPTYPIYRLINGKISCQEEPGQDWKELTPTEADYLLASLEGLPLVSVRAFSLRSDQLSAVRARHLSRNPITSRIRLHPSNVTAMTSSKRCKAQTRTGEPCLAPALKGQDVCRRHTIMERAPNR